MSEHTEGPWKAEPMAHPNRWLGWHVEGPSGIYPSEQRVAQLTHPRLDRLKEADACLIASAPELLEMLQVVNDAAAAASKGLDPKHSWFELQLRTHAVIAKASPQESKVGK